METALVTNLVCCSRANIEFSNQIMLKQTDNVKCTKKVISAQNNYMLDQFIFMEYVLAKIYDPASDDFTELSE